jgi:hypothetical protein
LICLGIARHALGLSDLHFDHDLHRGTWNSVDAKFRYVREAARQHAEAEADLAKDFEDA